MTFNEWREKAEFIGGSEEKMKAAWDAALEEAEDAMLGAFADMERAYLFTTGLDTRIIKARDAIRSLKNKATSNRKA